MASVLLYHHIQGLTVGVRAFADALGAAGHTVHTPDLFEGRTFATIPEGFAYAKEVGFDALHTRGLAAAEDLGDGLVYAGMSFGVTIAQRLAQTRPGAHGALLLFSCMPLSEFGGSWPEGVPVQIHGMAGDEFFDEDIAAARDLAESASAAELFVYGGSSHLFADSSLADYDADAAGLLMERVQDFLARLA